MMSISRYKAFEEQVELKRKFYRKYGEIPQEIDTMFNKAKIFKRGNSNVMLFSGQFIDANLGIKQKDSRKYYILDYDQKRLIGFTGDLGWGIHFYKNNEKIFYLYQQYSDGLIEVRYNFSDIQLLNTGIHDNTASILKYEHVIQLLQKHKNEIPIDIEPAIATLIDTLHNLKIDPNC